MNPRPTDPRTPRVAVIGAETQPGAFLRSVLEDHDVPGGSVELYGTTHGQAVLSQYDGEARLIQEPDPAEMADKDIVFLCESGEVAGEILNRASGDTLVIDLAQPPQAGGDARLAHADLRPPAGSGAAGAYTVPHYLSITLAELLHPLQSDPGISDLVVMVLRPAADFGQPGVEELREQTVNLLNFGKLPKEVFGRQLAFNCIPQHLVDAADGGLEERIASEIGHLLGCDTGGLSIRLVTIPVFYGHSALLRITPASGVGRADLEARLSAAPGTVLARNGDGAATPVETSGKRTNIISRIEEERPGRFWTWAVLDEAGTASATQALRLAEMLCNL